MIQEGDILSGRKLNLSFPNTLTFTEGSTIVGSENYSIQAEYVEDEYCTIGLYDSSDVLIDAFYTYDIPDASIVLNIPTYTLPADFGIVSTVDAESGLLQYISAVFGQEVASDTINMATYLSTHNDAAKTATNYLSWISQQEGLVISENPVTDISTITGGNTRINSEGMRVFDGTTQVARFGTTSVVGDETQKNLKITPTEVTMGDSSDQYFSVNMEGSPTGQEQSYYSNGTISNRTGDVVSLADTLTGASTWVSGCQLILWETITESGTDIPSELKDTLKAVFRFGTASTVSVTSSVLGVTYTYTYDGYDRMISKGRVLSNVSKRRSKYTAYVAVKSACLEFGEKNNDDYVPGAYSSCFGSELVALGYHQTVVGQLNDFDDTDSSTRNKHIFVVGNGFSETLRRNAFTVDWDANACINKSDYQDPLTAGTLTVAGKIYAKHDLAVTGNASVGGNITATGEVHGSNIFKIAHGKITDNNAPANGYQSIGPVSYSSTGFTSAPHVIIGFESSSTSSGFGRCSCSVYNVTATSFYARIFNADTTSRSPNLNWIAIGT